MGQEVPTDYIIPLKQLNVAGYMAQLNALYGQADRYRKLVTPVLLGMPDIPQMIMDYLKRLLDELLQKLREKLIELFTLLMAMLAKEMIPVINRVILVLNAVVDVVNAVVTGLFPYAKAIFQVMVACSIIYIVGKIVCEVIPDFGAGMGAVTVFTTPIKNVLKFLSDGAIWLYEWLKPVAYAILAGMRKLLQYFGFLNIIMGFINMLKMFTARDYAASSNDFINTAELWDDTAGEETVVPGEGLVTCTLPDGTTQLLSPQECIDAGGTFPGMDLLEQYADISNQIQLINDGQSGHCQAGEMCIHLDEEQCNARNESTGDCTWHNLYGDELVDCLLPEGHELLGNAQDDFTNFIVQVTASECVELGGTILTSDMLAQLLAEQAALLAQLNGLGLGGTLLNESIISSLLFPNVDVTQEDITQEHGAQYGFYGAQSGNYTIDDSIEYINTNNNNNMMKKGGKIKTKPKRKNK